MPAAQERASRIPAAYMEAHFSFLSSKSGFSESLSSPFEKKNVARGVGPRLRKYRPDGADFSYSLNWLDFLDGLDRLNFWERVYTPNSTGGITIVIPRNALHKPAKMLPVESVNVKSSMILGRVKVRDWLPRPQVNGHIICDICSCLTAIVK
jgi:hypothetical protein